MLLDAERSSAIKKGAVLAKGEGKVDGARKNILRNCSTLKRIRFGSLCDTERLGLTVPTLPLLSLPFAPSPL